MSLRIGVSQASDCDGEAIDDRHRRTFAVVQTTTMRWVQGLLPLEDVVGGQEALVVALEVEDERPQMLDLEDRIVELGPSHRQR